MAPRQHVPPYANSAGKLPLVLQGFNFCTHKSAPGCTLNFTTEINNLRPFCHKRDAAYLSIEIP